MPEATTSSPTTHTPAPVVPDIGQPFTHNGQPYAVRGWARRTRRPGPPAGPDHRPLVHCGRDDAEYVITSGLPGTIFRVTDIAPNPRPVFQASTIQAARTMADHLNGQLIHPHNPKGQPLMHDSRGIPDITFTDGGTAIQIRYRVTTDHTATIPLDELPNSVDDLCAEQALDPDTTDDRTKLDLIAEDVESDLDALLNDHTDFDNADGTDYELTFIPPND